MKGTKPQYAMSMNQIADELGVKPRRIQSIVDRALAKLRRSNDLRDYYDHLFDRERQVSTPFKDDNNGSH